MTVQLSWMSIIAVGLPLLFFASIGFIDLLQKFGYLVPRKIIEKEKREEAEKKERRRIEEEEKKERRIVEEKERERRNEREEYQNDLFILINEKTEASIKQFSNFKNDVINGFSAISLQIENYLTDSRKQYEVFLRDHNGVIDSFQLKISKQLTVLNTTLNLVRDIVVKHKGEMDDVFSIVSDLSENNKKCIVLLDEEFKKKVDNVQSKVEHHDYEVHELLRLQKLDVDNSSRNICNIVAIGPKLEEIFINVRSLEKKISDLERKIPLISEEIQKLSSGQKLWYEHVLQQGQEIIKLFRVMVKAWEYDDKEQKDG